MHSAAKYRLDWRSELERLSPYLNGNGGVVRIEYNSDDAAPSFFNHILKEDFGKPDNKMWISLRIYPEWFTTRKVPGILDEIDRLLAEVGFPAKKIPTELKILTNNVVGHDLNVTIEGLTIHQGGGPKGIALRERTASVCAAMSRYVKAGGQFMITVNDAPILEQTDFWQQIWNAGLAEAGGGNLVLMIHAGPKAERQQHDESPEPNEIIILPDSVETDEIRCEHIYDDLIDAFTAAGVQDSVGSATVHLESNKQSVLQLHMKLSASIMAVKMREEQRRG